MEWLIVLWAATAASVILMIGSSEIIQRKIEILIVNRLFISRRTQYVEVK